MARNPHDPSSATAISPLVGLSANAFIREAIDDIAAVVTMGQAARDNDLDSPRGCPYTLALQLTRRWRGLSPG